MKELVEALGPFPTLQGIVIGLIVAGMGAWAILKGLRQEGGRDKDDLEEAKAKWEDRRQLKHLTENSFKIVKLLERSNDLAEDQLAATNRFNDQRWNSKQ